MHAQTEYVQPPARHRGGRRGGHRAAADCVPNGVGCAARVTNAPRAALVFGGKDIRIAVQGILSVKRCFIRSR
jgi:hypothetical protein